MENMRNILLARSSHTNKEYIRGDNMYKGDMGDFFEYLGFKEAMEKSQKDSEVNKLDKLFEQIDNLCINNSDDEDDE